MLRHLAFRFVVAVGLFWLKVEWPHPDCPCCIWNCVMEEHNMCKDGLAGPD